MNRLGLLAVVLVLGFCGTAEAAWHRVHLRATGTPQTWKDDHVLRGSAPVIAAVSVGERDLPDSAHGAKIVDAVGHGIVVRVDIRSSRFVVRYVRFRSGVRWFTLRWRREPAEG